MVTSGGPYGAQPAGTTVVENINLADSDYAFTIFDTFGDGICCAGYPDRYVVISLENVIDYVDYLSGSYIPASHANYIIAQVNLMIDAIGDGSAACCGGNRPANPGTAPVTKALELEASPNPFSEEVSISFYLPEAGPATLEVFNLNGQRVTALHTGYLDAGFQRFSWNGGGEDGQRLSGGVYLIRLQAESGTLTQKVSLMR